MTKLEFPNEMSYDFDDFMQNIGIGVRTLPKFKSIENKIWYGRYICDNRINIDTTYFTIERLYQRLKNKKTL